jgi:hypothetical protein
MMTPHIIHGVIDSLRLDALDELIRPVASFTLLTLRYGETVKRIKKGRQTKINRTVSKQITDEEKLTIATLHTPYSPMALNEGNYTFTNLVQLLAQNVASFTKIYNPGDNERIGKYLKTRASKYQHLSAMTSQGNKGKGPPNKRQKVHQTSQRAWTYLGETAAPAFTAPPPYQSGKSYGKGKSKSKDGFRSKRKGKGKGKGKSKGKSLSFLTVKGTGKGKGKSKGQKGKQKPSKGKSFSRGPVTGLSTFGMQSSTLPVNTQIKCHFCHIVGHIKPNCRKWLALSQSEQYQHRQSYETKYQLIYDHLEDSVLAPRYYQYCSNDNCDGENCESPFDYADYEEASVFFTQSLRQLVINAKLAGISLCFHPNHNLCIGLGLQDKPTAGLPSLVWLPSRVCSNSTFRLGCEKPLNVWTLHTLEWTNRRSCRPIEESTCSRIIL